MQYLNVERLRAMDEMAFRNQRPYPWINPEGFLTEEGFQLLRDTLPDLSLFESRFGEPRKFGQQSHDRYALEYRDDLAVPEPWKAFVAELRGTEYQGFLRRMLGTRAFDVSFHWHYTPTGCSVSPHCDAARKMGSHIFYFNTKDDWDPEWGGETVILDDEGRFPRQSAPRFEEFARGISSQSIGNYSLLFVRNGNSWHGVRTLQCPEGRFRKVFIVVINQATPVTRLKRLLGVGRTKS